MKYKHHLVEGQHGTGARRVLPRPLHRLVVKTKRAFRPKLAMAVAPFSPTDVPAIKARLAAIGPVKIKNQGASASCGGQAGSYWLGIVWAVTKGIKYIEFSAKSIYSLIAYEGGGTTDGDLQNQISNGGAMTEAMVPSSQNGVTSELFMTDKSWATDPNKIVASQYAGWVKVSVAINKDAMLCAIRDHIAFVWHIEGQDGNGWHGYRPSPPSKSNPNPIWGHFMEEDDVDPITMDILARQSWGPEIGNNGIQAFNVDYISSGHILDAWTWVPKYVPNPIDPGQMVPNPVVITWQQRLFNYFMYLFGSVKQSMGSVFSTAL